jgi:hypothetical protein
MTEKIDLFVLPKGTLVEQDIFDSYTFKLPDGSVKFLTITSGPAVVVTTFDVPPVVDVYAAPPK